MKKIFLMLLCPALLWGCKNFLDETSQDEFRPRTIDDLMRIAYGEAYPVNQEDVFMPFIDLLTDDVKSRFPGQYTGDNLKSLALGEPVFTWSWEMFDKMADLGSAGATTYQKLYDKIMGCNVVLDYCGEMIGTQAERDNVRGQMLAMRSFYYLTLVNLFAAPYNDERIDPATAPGVALILESAARDEFPKRATLKQVYDQIERDLLESMPLLEAYGQGNQYFQATPLFPVLLLSRAYLYQERWDEALEYAQKVIDKKPLLYNFVNTYGEDSDDGHSITPGIYNIGSPEMIWAYAQAGDPQGHAQGGYFKVIAGTTIPPYQVSDETWLLFKKGDNDGNMMSATPFFDSKDLRAQNYFSNFAGPFSMGPPMSMPIYPLGCGKGQRAGLTIQRTMSRGLRNVEAYLIRAEVNAVKFAETGDAAARTQALDDINHILLNRWNTAKSTFEPITATTAEELTQAVRDERRRELVFEDHRWFDLRRYGMPELKHTFQGSAEASVQTYTLARGDARYVLPIPTEALKLNPELEQNAYPNH